MPYRFPLLPDGLRVVRAAATRRSASLLLLGVLVAVAGVPALAEDRATAAAVPGSGSGPRNFQPLGDLVLFEISSPTDEVPWNTALWRTDGTRSGTFAIRDSVNGLHYLEGGEGELYFLTVDTRWHLGRTDGTGQGTRLMPPLGGNDFIDSGWRNQVYSAALDRLLFVSYEANVGGAALWSWDGSAAPAVLLRRFSAPLRADLISITAVGDAVFVLTHETSPDAPRKTALWTSDGTPEGTRRLGYVPDDPEAVGPLTAIGGDRVVFFASSSFCDLQLWRGSATEPPARIARFQDDRCRNRLPSSLRGHGDLAFTFAYDNQHDQELWTTDGTAAGTRRLTDFDYEHALGFEELPLHFAPTLDEGLFFQPIDPAASALWRTDGTLDGTVPLTAPCTEDCGAFGLPTMIHDGDLYWVFSPAAGSPFEVWASDGFTAPAELAAFPPRPDATLLSVTGAQDAIFFFLETHRTALELWVHRLGSGRVDHVADFPWQFGVTSVPAAAIGDRLFFTADDGFHGGEPWVSDGTAAGTRMFADLVPRGTGTERPPTPQYLSTYSVQDQVVLNWWVAATFEANGWAHVEARSPGRDWTEVARGDATSLGAQIEGLEPDTPYSFRVRLETAAGIGDWSETTSFTTGELPYYETPCEPSDSQLCFQEGRFGVRVHWWDQHNSDAVPRTGVGHRVPDAEQGRSGYFWFFKPDNVELIVKLLDGGKINGHAWTFYGALTDVEYWVTVDDHWTSSRRTYYNPPGEICGLGDTTAFYSDGASAASMGGALAVDAAPPARATAAAHPFIPCVEDATTLCLLDGRYAVTVDWQDQHNQRTGVGGAVPYADRSGFFWFFKPDNIELVVKVLDGTPVNGKVWVLYGALTDVGYTITVTDTASGHDVRRYVNEPGSLCGGADTAAF